MEMTSRERMMIAMKNGVPDRVPVAPDFSNMIPCRLTGKPFWEIYINQNPPLWKAYLDAVKYFGTDGWMVDDVATYKQKSNVVCESTVRKEGERWYREDVYHTPDGDLKRVILSTKSDPPVKIEKLIKDFKEDFKKIRHLYSDITGYDCSLYRVIRKETGELGAVGTYIDPPGLHIFQDFFDGNINAVTYAYYDEPELFMELCSIFERFNLQKLEIAIELGVDFILTGGSGSITLQSPEIWEELSLPSIKKYTKIAKESGVISGIHSCGKEMHLLKKCAEETDLDYVNPLEIPPMGDCTLKEAHGKYGSKLALMGNLHTTDVMLNGSSDLVRLESLKAIRDAGLNGGFILSTGDQCGRDTPDENIFAMVEIAKEYGHYPLDLDRIEAKIRELEKNLC
jgi:uroporphyrinogen decarboxylase